MATKVYGWEKESTPYDGERGRYTRFIHSGGKLQYIVYHGGRIVLPSNSFQKKFPRLIRTQMVELKNLLKELDTPNC